MEFALKALGYVFSALGILIPAGAGFAYFTREPQTSAYFEARGAYSSLESEQRESAAKWLEGADDFAKLTGDERKRILEVSKKDRRIARAFAANMASFAAKHEAARGVTINAAEFAAGLDASPQRDKMIALFEAGMGGTAFDLALNMGA